MENIKKYSTLLALLGLIVVLAVFTEGSFLDARNLTNLTRQISVNGILAVGMTMIILTSGIDLSVGSVVALSGVIIGLLQVNVGLMNSGASGAMIAGVGGIVVGLVCGIMNGAMISFFKIPPFVITLGMMVIARGLALIFSGSSAISPVSDEFQLIARGFIPVNMTIVVLVFVVGGWLYNLRKRFSILSLLIEGACIAILGYAFVMDRGIPVPALLMAFATIVGIIVLNKFPYGRYLYAIGGNEDAAQLSGVPVKKIKLIAYSVMGLLAGLAGCILTARLNSAAPTEGQLMELDAIASVVIGGTSLMGGAGGIVGSLIGAFLIGTLNNGMDLLSIDSNYQMVVKGVIIIFAVWSDARAKKKMSR